MTEDIVPIGEYVFDEPGVDMDEQSYSFATGITGLVDENGAPLTPQIVRWHVTDTGRAEWAMNKLAEARDRLAQRRAEHQAFVDRVAEWLRDASAQDERRARWLEWELGEFGIAARTDQAKTIQLVSGAIATRESKPQAVVEDQEAFRFWWSNGDGAGWDDYDDVITEETVYKVHLTELRKHCTPRLSDAGWIVTDNETGEIIPGLGVSEGKITATVEPA